MTDELSSAPPPAPARGAPVEEIILVLLVVLSGIGVMVNDYAAPQTAFRLWLWLTPVFGVVSTVAAWSRAQRRGEPVGAIVPTQVVHWLGVVGAVLLIYVLQVYGRMQNEAAGSAVLVVLALATFLAGVYTDWRLSVLGVVLGGTVVGFAYVERVALVIVPILLVAIVALVVYMRGGSTQ
jgi:hypothetical protein